MELRMNKTNDANTPRTMGYDNNHIAIAIILVLCGVGAIYYGYTTWTAPAYVAPTHATAPMTEPAR